LEHSTAGDVSGSESTEERTKPKEDEKSGRETGKARSEAAAGSKTSGSAPNAGPRSSGRSDNTNAVNSAGASKGAAGISEYQKVRQLELAAVLAKRSGETADARAIVKEFAVLWLPHHLVEAEMLAPSLDDAGADEEEMGAVRVRKDILHVLLADLLQSDAVRFGRAKLDALSDAFDSVVDASDRERESLSEAKEADEGLSALGSQMSARYERVRKRFENLDETIGEAMVMLAPRSLSVPSMRQRSPTENSMSRYSDRDEHGRFMPEDEREHSRGYRGGPERDYRGGPERDEAGRFMSESGPRSRGRYDDDERYGGRSMGRGRDDGGRFMGGEGRSMGRGRDDGGRFMGGSSESRGRGRGEWSGDSEGRSESRRGQGESGWYGDREGRSEVSRGGWRSESHGERGWHGDPEGHSEAARRGWEGGHRGQSRHEDDDRGYENRRMSSRYEDDDRGSRGRGHGGWSGDSEGHSEASRRGREHRR
jgi:hypothetical protein